MSSCRQGCKQKINRDIHSTACIYRFYSMVQLSLALYRSRPITDNITNPTVGIQVQYSNCSQICRKCFNSVRKKCKHGIFQVFWRNWWKDKLHIMYNVHTVSLWLTDCPIRVWKLRVRKCRVWKFRESKQAQKCDVPVVSWMTYKLSSAAGRVTRATVYGHSKSFCPVPTYLLYILYSQFSTYSTQHCTVHCTLYTYLRLYSIIL